MAGAGAGAEGDAFEGVVAGGAESGSGRILRRVGID